MKDAANVVQGQKEAIHDTVTEVETKIMIAMGGMEAQTEQ